MAQQYSAIPTPARITLVTQTNNGLMTSADKVKLDGLRSADGSTLSPLNPQIVAPLETAVVSRVEEESKMSYACIMDIDTVSEAFCAQIIGKNINGTVDFSSFGEVGQVNGLSYDLNSVNGFIELSVTNNSGVDFEVLVRVI
jgi:hypothetical protein